MIKITARPLIITFTVFVFGLFITSDAAYSQTPYPPVPTGDFSTCQLDFQRPMMTDTCSKCLYDDRQDIRTEYNNAGQSSCSNIQVYNHWCNGGLGTQAIGDCNGLKNGICSQPPDFPCATPTRVPGPPTLIPTPPSTVNTPLNPRGCGILYTSGVPSCWCNNGGGQGLCGKLPLDGPGGCRDLCEKGEFTGSSGYTHCFMMTDNSQCRSNDDGTYRFCLNRCLPASPGFSQEIGCEYPNKTVFGKPEFDSSCLLAFDSSSNNSFYRMFESVLKRSLQYADIRKFIDEAVRVPGLQKANCNPAKESCTYE